MYILVLGRTSLIFTGGGQIFDYILIENLSWWTNHSALKCGLGNLKQ